MNRILLVDDDVRNSMLLKRYLEVEGFDVTYAPDGTAGWKMYCSSRPDLILLDVNMPGMDGFEVVQTLRQRGVRIPIMIVSGRQEDYDTLYGLDIGADDYVTKPFNPVVLGAKVKALIRRSRNHGAGSAEEIIAGPFRYHTGTLRFYKNGREIPLSSKENAMMKLFMELYIICTTMVKGIGLIVTSTATQAAPKEMAIGIPKAINARKRSSKITLILI